MLLMEESLLSLKEKTTQPVINIIFDYFGIELKAIESSSVVYIVYIFHKGIIL